MIGAIFTYLDTAGKKTLNQKQNITAAFTLRSDIGFLDRFQERKVIRNLYNNTIVNLALHSMTLDT